jgi:hypothetical protein
MSKIVIVYHSGCGGTKKVAEAGAPIFGAHPRATGHADVTFRAHRRFFARHRTRAAMRF